MCLQFTFMHQVKKLLCGITRPYEKVTDLYLFQSHLATNNEQKVELYSQYIFKVNQAVIRDYFSHPIF